MSNNAFRAMIARNNWVVLDTETTGLRHPAEICQIAIASPTGDVLLDTLVKPVRPIPFDVTRIHGITNAMVKEAQSWADVRPTVLSLIEGKDVIVYNAAYDRKLMHWSDEACGQKGIDYKANATWWCAMEAYAEHYGQKNSYYSSYRSQRLTDAMRQQKLSVSNAHHALGDVLMTIALVQQVWGTPR